MVIVTASLEISSSICMDGQFNPLLSVMASADNHNLANNANAEPGPTPFPLHAGEAGRGRQQFVAVNPEEDSPPVELCSPGESSVEVPEQERA